MSRLTEKLKMVGEIVPRQTAKIEARADAMMARETEIEDLTHKAFSPHEGILAETAKGLDDLERQLALVTNGPLQGSDTSMKPEQSEKKNNG